MDDQHSNKPLLARLIDNLLEERCAVYTSSRIKDDEYKPNHPRQPINFEAQHQCNKSQNSVGIRTMGSSPMLVDFGESTAERPAHSRRRILFSRMNRRCTLDTQESDFTACHVHRLLLQRRKTDALQCMSEKLAKPVHQDASGQLKKITDCGELLVDWGEMCDDADKNYPNKSIRESGSYPKQFQDENEIDDESFVIRCSVLKSRMSSITITDDFDDQFFSQYDHGEFDVDKVAMINELRGATEI